MKCKLDQKLLAAERLRGTNRPLTLLNVKGARKSRDFLMRRPMQAELSRSVVQNRDRHQSRHDPERTVIYLLQGTR